MDEAAAGFAVVEIFRRGKRWCFSISRPNAFRVGALDVPDDSSEETARMKAQQLLPEAQKITRSTDQPSLG